MIVVEASWEDHSGALRAIPARMENKSHSGACIRVPIPIAVGSKLRIHSRWEQFTGVAKYCLSEGMEYLVGIQRDMTNIPLLDGSVAAESAALETVETGDPPAVVKKTRNRVKPKQNPAIEIVPVQETVEVERIVAVTATAAVAIPVRDAGHKNENMDLVSIPQPQGLDVLPGTEGQTKPSPQEKQVSNERRHMRRSWLGSALWNNKQDSPKLDEDGAIGNGNGNSNGNREGEVEQASRVLEVAAPLDRMRTNPVADGVTRFHAEPLGMEDIYRAAGIMNPRKGYGINKVVEMLHSEHVRGLSKEMKRAAVLMALDAAGIPIEEVLMDARARQNALDSYEAGQKKLVEAEWMRKAEENLQIQAELERIKEQFAARISRQLNGVAREKAAFSSWQAVKQQESQNMTEAAELCLKLIVSEKTSTSPPEISMAVTSGKPV